MYSIRKKPARAPKALVAAALAVAAAAGCSHVASLNKPVVVKTPMPVAEATTPDEATMLRPWKRSLALYHSGATQAWSTRWYYNPNPDNTDVVNYILDPAMGIVQTVTLPATAVPDYPYRKVVYAGDVAPLSYNAMPPLPPTPPMGLPNPDPDPLSAPQEPVLPPLPPIGVEAPPMILPPAPKDKAVKAKSQAAPSTRPAEH